MRHPSLSTLNKKLWRIFSKYVRISESDGNGLSTCFSCDSVQPWIDMDAGHYIPKSISLALRFDERNVHAQCTACNRFRHGNLTQYALNLKKVYGPDILEELDNFRRDHQNLRYSKSDYLDLIEKYQRKLDECSKRSFTS